MGLNDDFGAKERVRVATDIVDLVGRYMTLRRQGRNFVGICPWHDDSRPSLQVSPERQSWKCWVCNLGGDCFSFLMQMDNLTFPEALQRLADDAGIPLYRDPPVATNHFGISAGTTRTGGNASKSGEFTDVESSPASPPTGSRSERAELLHAAAWVENLYHRFLLDAPEAEPARRYLSQRGIKEESIERFRIGYAPAEWNFLEKEWRAPDLRDARNSREGGLGVLERLGLLVSPETGRRPYDRFRGRVIFPIHDASGRPIALGGRVLPESGNTSPAKYINSPETPLFRKSRELYGLDLARTGIRNEKSVLVMEGYTDVILAHQHGCGHAVAVLGTALNEQHLRILKRYTERIDLVLDGDTAGQRRAAEVIEYFLAANVDARITTLPDGFDPADFLVAHGGTAFREMLDRNTLDALEHAYQLHTRGVDREDIHGTMRAMDAVLDLLSRVPRLGGDTQLHHRLREEKTLKRLAFLFHVSEQNLRARLSELRREQSRKPAFHRQRDDTNAGAAADADENRREDDDRAGGVELRESVEQDGPRNRETDPMAALTAEDLRPDGAQRELLELLIAQPTLLPQIRETVWSWQLRSAGCRIIYEKACELWDAGILPDYPRITLVFPQPRIQSLLAELIASADLKRLLEDDGSRAQKVLEEWLLRFSKRVMRDEQAADRSILQRASLVAKGDPELAPDPVEQIRLLAAIAERRRMMERHSPYAEEDEKRLRRREEERSRASTSGIPVSENDADSEDVSEMDSVWDEIAPASASDTAISRAVTPETPVSECGPSAGDAMSWGNGVPGGNNEDSMFQESPPWESGDWNPNDSDDSDWDEELP